MRHALVIYESMFGNTHHVADAVAAGLGKGLDGAVVTVYEVAEAPRSLPDDIDLLVVGGPTHAFSMSRPSTRKSAVEQGADPSVVDHEGIREWIAAVDTPGAPHVLRTAAFDTKVVKPHVPGSAAKAATRKLRHRGFAMASDPKTFYVTGTQGELVDGELDRARQWGVQLANS